MRVGAGIGVGGMGGVGAMVGARKMSVACVGGRACREQAWAAVGRDGRSYHGQRAVTKKSLSSVF